MGITLIQETENITDILYLACRVCYSKNNLEELKETCLKINKDKRLELIKRVLRSGHYSVAEHVYFTFAISNISRCCSHQLVRHRHFSFSQSSQRYITENNFEYNTPESINNNFKNEYDEFMENCQKLYSKMVEVIPPEDARYILPNAANSKMIVSMNLRSLIEFCNKRLCLQAQHEIRDLAYEMRNLVINNNSWLKEFLSPNCKNCNDFRECEMKNV